VPLPQLPKELVTKRIAAPNRSKTVASITKNVPLDKYKYWDIIARCEELAIAYRHSLPQVFEQRRRKQKTRDRERVERPHVTVLTRSKTWRLVLTTGEGMVDD
jgi:hypothetical protein